MYYRRDSSSDVGCFALFIIMLLITLVYGAIVQIGWNWVLVGAVGLDIPTINFGTACVIGFILALLFK